MRRNSEKNIKTGGINSIKGESLIGFPFLFFTKIARLTFIAVVMIITALGLKTYVIVHIFY